MTVASYVWAEKLINKAMTLDPQMPGKVKALSGKTVCLHFLEVEKKCHIIFDGSTIQLTEAIPTQIDLTLKARPSAFLSLLISSHGQREITIIGDSELAQNLLNLSKSLDIDWEEPLSHYVGDIAAHRLGRLARKAAQFAKKTRISLQSSLGEYLTEEARLTPSEAEVSHLYEGIHEIRDDIERLTIRIHRLQG